MSSVKGVVFPLTFLHVFLNFVNRKNIGTKRGVSDTTHV